MKNALDLLPDLREWNNGKGVKPEDWLCATARSDQAVAFTSLFWPKIVVYNGYVLRHDFREADLKNAEAGNYTRSKIEAMLNYSSLENFFKGADEIGAVANERAYYICEIMADMLDAKLRRDLPDRRCRVVFLNDQDDFALSFCQE